MEVRENILAASDAKMQMIDIIVIEYLFTSFLQVIYNLSTGRFAVAVINVIVDITGGLKKRIANHTTEKSESSSMHILAYCIGDWR